MFQFKFLVKQAELLAVHQFVEKLFIDFFHSRFRQKSFHRLLSLTIATRIFSSLTLTSPINFLSTPFTSDCDYNLFIDYFHLRLRQEIFHRLISLTIATRIFSSTTFTSPINFSIDSFHVRLRQEYFHRLLSL
jgi:hypothetical protein